jgi:hypothetical protein
MTKEEFLSEINQTFEDEKTEEKSFPISKDVLKLLWSIPFEKWSEATGNEKLKLTEEEKELLATTTAEWLNVRLPQFLLRYPIDFQFALAVLSVLTSKLIAYKQGGKSDYNNTGNEGFGENNFGKGNNQGS